MRHEVVDVAVLRSEDRQHLLLCQQSPTETRVAGNGGVRSARDNVASSLGMAANLCVEAATASIEAVGNQERGAWSTQVNGC